MMILRSTRRQHRYDKGMDVLDIDRLAELKGYIRRLGCQTRQNARSRRRVGTWIFRSRARDPSYERPVAANKASPHRYMNLLEHRVSIHDVGKHNVNKSKSSVYPHPFRCDLAYSASSDSISSGYLGLVLSISSWRQLELASNAP